MTPRSRVCSLLRQALAPVGLDVVIPLTAEAYNAHLIASNLERYRLPLPSSTLDSHLLVLVGNSKAIWAPFLTFAEQEIKQRAPEGLALDPLDRFVQQSVQAALETLTATEEALFKATKVYWVTDMEPGKMILAQRMALVSRAVSNCSASHMCIHPTLGPWLGLRCAILFAVDGALPDGQDEEEFEVQPAECSHSEELHAVVTKQLEDAFKHSDGQPTAPGQRLPPGAWRAWALPRLSLAPDHPAMYSDEQLLYHHAKDRSFLPRVVVAKKQQLSSDYLLEPPSANVVDLRRLLQQVLREIREREGDEIDGILLSGGLDTSILAEASDDQLGPQLDDPELIAVSLDKRGAGAPMLKFRHAFVVQAHEDALDAVYASAIYDRLRGESIGELHVLRKSLDELLTDAREAAKLLVTCDPMELRNSLVVYAALKAAAARGAKTIMTGDGADELFLGYSFYHSMDEAALRKMRSQVMNIMVFTAPKLARALGIRIISPYLDERVIEFARQLVKPELVGERTPVPRDGPSSVHGKLILRQAFPEAYSQWRSKQPIESGAGTTALRLGHFDATYTDAEFETKQREVFRAHAVWIRDKEHLFFFEAMLEAFDGDLGNVPRPRSLAHWKVDAGVIDSEVTGGFCPACGFQLTHSAQDYCATCGQWPTRASETNDKQGFATKALQQLARDRDRCLMD